ncbi:MAG TPA: bifunctional adenosylcobinamide kinase/adenosylcobinamide-phosphate guanylyltransferase [Rhodopila sp.]
MVAYPTFASVLAIPEAPQTTLVLGGARSGKSRYAEEIMIRHSRPWIYLATAQALDDEMRHRVAEHQARRGEGWVTVETPIAVSDVLRREATRPVLVDCLTLWLSNLILGEHDLPAATADLVAVLNRRQTPTVLVSNEVGLGIVPETPLGRSFRDEAGRLNQAMAALAGKVVFMVAGLPMTVK